MKLVDQLRIGARSVRYGDRVIDQLAIAFVIGMYPLHPIGTIARRFGFPLPDPARIIKSYRCRSPYGVFACPGGAPYFLACDPTYDPGVASVIDQLHEGTFVDVGANVGFFTVRAARLLGAKGHVIAIEPHPTRHDFL